MCHNISRILEQKVSPSNFFQTQHTQHNERSCQDGDAGWDGADAGVQIQASSEVHPVRAPFCLWFSQRAKDKSAAYESNVKMIGEFNTVRTPRPTRASTCHPCAGRGVLAPLHARGQAARFAANV